MPMHVPSTCLSPCRCILVKCADVTEVVREGMCAAGGSSWTPSLGTAAWKNGDYVSCV